MKILKRKAILPFLFYAFVSGRNVNYFGILRDPLYLGLNAISS